MSSSDSDSSESVSKRAKYVEAESADAPKRKTQPQSKYWVFTWHGPPKDDEGNRASPALWPEPQFDADMMDALQYQMEIAPSTGKYHYQGAVAFKTRKRSDPLREALAIPGAWTQMMRGSDKDQVYTNKEETRAPGYEPHMHGVWPRITQGKRNDIQAYVEDRKAGSTNAELAEKHASVIVRHYKGLDALFNLPAGRPGQVRDRHTPVQVYVYWGAAGTGKSREIWDKHPDLYEKDPNTTWWCGYKGEDVVLLDDYEGTLPWNYLLKILDRYPMRTQTKGGHVQLLATKFYLTSNLPYTEWYGRYKDYAALTRRITEVRHFTLPDPTPEPVAERTAINRTLVHTARTIS
ncbi:replication-associated protein [McMurdo Ice Shelf pond-associated circular DNA virus-4]|uniref:replication-associated protein n=1 Tax=McMurdo Ice Shelf pond-associated circular DNA virus-4 TaxID=1521388 RepID=UPI0004D0E00E|nr:replication-associated protein [McMurdo Ice Shelf pond-associated circular DNA virus-4]AIF71509.1 replication-associated protein [McMurdo Ice Shelf pond-associated circular DNA virus-4]